MCEGVSITENWQDAPLCLCQIDEMKRLHFSLFTFLFMAGAAGAAEKGASAWSVDLQSQMRLVAGEAKKGVLLAGIEITLAPRFKTYWRSPGEAGVPPVFDFSASTNLKKAEVLFPAPQSFVDAGGLAIGYHDRVIFPVLVEPVDPEKPVLLALKLAYGACEKICIPAEGTAQLDLPQPVNASLSQDVASAVAKVPVQHKGFGNPADQLPVTRLTALPGAERKSSIELAVAGEVMAAYGEGPEGWYLESKKPEPSNTGTKVTLDIYAPRKTPYLAPCPIVLTIIGKDHAVERHVTLDECGQKP
jgi:DsbC/DsbD-like thiol-disulfide interchange protein